MRAAIAWPSLVAGSNSNWRTAASAASSKPLPTGATTLASVTLPSTPIIRMTSSRQAFLRQRRRGQLASTKRNRQGGLVSAARLGTGVEVWLVSGWLDLAGFVTGSTAALDGTTQADGRGSDSDERGAADPLSKSPGGPCPLEPPLLLGWMRSGPHRRTEGMNISKGKHDHVDHLLDEDEAERSRSPSRCRRCADEGGVHRDRHSVSVDMFEDATRWTPSQRIDAINASLFRRRPCHPGQARCFGDLRRLVVPDRRAPGYLEPAQRDPLPRQLDGPSEPERRPAVGQHEPAVRRSTP